MDRDDALLSELSLTDGRLGLWRVYTSSEGRGWETHWNPAMFDMFGLPRGSAEPEFGALFQHYHPDDRRTVQQVFSKLVATREPQSARYRIVRGDGAIVHVFSRAWLATCATRGEHVQGFNLDITGAFDDEALQESERMYRFLADNSREMLTRTTPAGIFEFVSNASSKLIGYAPEEMVGRRVDEFVDPEWFAVNGPMVAKGAKDGAARFGQFQFRMRHKDGHWTWIESAPRAVFDYDGNLIGWIDVMRDISQRKALETEARTHQQARLVAEAANQAKSDFLATMSHELRTPLNAIIGYAEIIQEAPDSAQDDAARIGRAAKHLLGLINQILDMGKVESGQLAAHFAPCALDEVFREIEETVRPLAAANANALSVAAPCDLTAFVTDERLLKQCMLNLAGNACKFTSNGTVRIEASTVTTPTGRFLRCAVIDTGIGITPDVAERLFQPFVQADPGITRRFGGTGLGLALTKRLAQALGGDVTLDSTPGKGAQFTLTIRDGGPATAAARDAA